MRFEVMASGLMFPEGPIAMEDGSIIVVEIAGGALTRVAPNGCLERIADLGGGPNGAAIGPDGAVYVCNNGGMGWRWEGEEILPTYGPAPNYTGGSIQRVDLSTGEWSLLYDSCEGELLAAPNDIVFDRSGGFWFTDHGKVLADGRTDSAVCYAKPDGSAIRRVYRAARSFNGVGLSPDEKTLYAANTFGAEMLSFALAGPGTLAEPEPQTICALGSPRCFDSLAVGAGGEIYVGGLLPGAIVTVTEKGVQADDALPDPYLTNICFGGPGLKIGFATGSQTGRLFRIEGLGPGLKLNFGA